MSRPLPVSIIIPCYNDQSWVGEAIESALAQTYQPREIIVVDDGSTDDSLATIRAHGEDVQVITQQNKGASSARNIGLAQARGAYICFLDADDLLYPDKISHQIRLAEQNHPDVIAGSYVYLDQNENKTRHSVTTDLWHGLITSQLGRTSSNLWKKEALCTIGGWNEHWPSSQEYELLFRLLQAKADVLSDNEPKTIIRQRENSISSTPPDATTRLRILLRSQIREYLHATQQINEDLEEQVNLFIFENLRRLFDYDPQEATNLYHQLLPSSFRPSVSNSVSWRYGLALKVFGFYAAETLASVWKRSPGSNEPSAH